MAQWGFGSKQKNNNCFNMKQARVIPHQQDWSHFGYLRHKIFPVHKDEGFKTLWRAVLMSVKCRKGLQTWGLSHLSRCPVVCVEPPKHQDHVNPTAAHVVKENFPQILQGLWATGETHTCRKSKHWARQQQPTQSLKIRGKKKIGGDIAESSETRQMDRSSTYIKDLFL